MANAHQDAKKAAGTINRKMYTCTILIVILVDYVTLSNMEEGVAVVLEKVLNQIRAKKAAATSSPAQLN